MIYQRMKNAASRAGERGAGSVKKAVKLAQHTAKRAADASFLSLARELDTVANDLFDSVARDLDCDGAGLICREAARVLREAAR